MDKIFILENIGPYFSEELAYFGIHTRRQLEKCLSSKKCIKDMENSTHIEHNIVDNWAHDFRKY